MRNQEKDSPQKAWNKRVSVSISLTETEKKELTQMAESYSLSLSAFLRIAAKEYGERHKK